MTDLTDKQIQEENRYAGKYISALNRANYEVSLALDASKDRAPVSHVRCKIIINLIDEARRNFEYDARFKHD